MSRILLYSFILLVLTGCKTPGDAVSDQPTISKQDYPYIEKFHKAMRLKVTGRVDEAAVLLNECLEIRQDDDAVYYALAKIEYDQGNQELSLEHMKRAAELDSDNTWYIQELAYLYFDQEEYALAATNFKKLVDIEPRNIDWMYGYGEALAASGQEQKAIDAYNKLEAQVGEYPDLYIQKFRMYMAMKKKSEAEAELLKGNEKYPKDARLIANLVDFYYQGGEEAKAINMLKELVKADPTNGRAHLMLAEVYNGEGNLDAALESLKAAFKSSDIDVETKVRILSGLNREMPSSDSDLKELIAIVVEMYPDDFRVHLLNGDHLVAESNNAEALKAYKQALALDKSEYAVWNQVLLLEYQLFQFDSLYVNSKECLTYFPTSSNTYLMFALAANQLKKYNEVEDAVMAGEALVSSSDNEMKAEFEGQLGESYFGLKKYEEGEAAFEKAIKLNASNLIKNNYAYNLAKHNRNLDKAMTLIDEVLSKSMLAQYLDTKGFIYFKKGNYSEAKKLFDEAYSKAAKDAIILEHLGDVHSKLGDNRQAIEFWMLAAKLSPKREVLQKKLELGKYVEEGL